MVRYLWKEEIPFVILGGGSNVLVTEIYASREASNDNVSSSQVVQSMDHPDVLFLASNNQVTDYLVSNLKRGDVLMVLSAGDANQISENVIDLLSVNGNRKMS
jgi:UDP-N-acetylmuramate--alanine ligase